VFKLFILSLVDAVVRTLPRYLEALNTPNLHVQNGKTFVLMLRNEELRRRCYKYVGIILPLLSIVLINVVRLVLRCHPSMCLCSGHNQDALTQRMFKTIVLILSPHYEPLSSCTLQLLHKLELVPLRPLEKECKRQDIEWLSPFLSKSMQKHL